MILLGLSVAVTFSLSIRAAPDEQRHVAAALLWLTTFLAAGAALDRSFAAEHECGGWDALRLYPISPAAVFLAKLAGNVVALGALQAILVPAFAALCGLPLAEHPWALLVVVGLGNVGLAAAGTLLSALSAGLRQGAGVLTLLMFPVAVPLLLATIEATSLCGAPEIGEPWWRWVELLALFAAVFVVAGTVLVGYLMEE